MFFFHHPRKVTSNKEVAVQVVQNKDQRTPIDTKAAVLVVDHPVAAPQAPLAARQDKPEI
jgi:hypothetical protein